MYPSEEFPVETHQKFLDAAKESYQEFNIGGAERKANRENNLNVKPTETNVKKPGRPTSAVR
jgi:hypothetical protein